jgi:hypothetical protein
MDSHAQTRSSRTPPLRPGPSRIPGLFDIPAAGCRRRADELTSFVETLIAPNRRNGVH